PGQKLTRSRNTIALSTISHGQANRILLWPHHARSLRAAMVRGWDWFAHSAKTRHTKGEMMKSMHSRQIATHDFLRSWLRVLLAVSLALGLVGFAQAQQRGEVRAKISRELADELDGLTR